MVSDDEASEEAAQIIKVMAAEIDDIVRGIHRAAVPTT